MPLRTPGPVVALRIVVWVQATVLAVGGLLGGLLAGVSSTGLGSDDELTQGFAGLGVVLGLAAAVLGFVAAALLAVPTLFLRTGRPGRKVGSLMTICVVETLLALLLLAVVVTNVVGGRPGDSVVSLVLAAPPVAVLVLASRPVSRAWANGAFSPPAGMPPGAPPPVGWPPAGASPPGAWPHVGSPPPPGAWPPAGPTGGPVPPTGPPGGWHHPG